MYKQCAARRLEGELELLRAAPCTFALRSCGAALVRQLWRGAAAALARRRRRRRHRRQRLRSLRLSHWQAAPRHRRGYRSAVGAPPPFPAPSARGAAAAAAVSGAVAGRWRLTTRDCAHRPPSSTGASKRLRASGDRGKTPQSRGPTTITVFSSSSFFTAAASSGARPCGWGREERRGGRGGGGARAARDGAARPARPPRAAKRTGGGARGFRAASASSCP